MRRISVRILAIAAVLMVVASACSDEEGDGGGTTGAETADEYVVGYAAALTGGLAPFDTPFKDGLEVAVELLNDQGGINGSIPIRLEIKDMKSDAALAVQVAQELIDSGIDMLITACDVDLSIASGTVAQAAEIPAMSSCSTTPTVPTAVGDYMFLVSMGDNAQAAVDAEYALAQGWETAYILGSPDTGYTAQMPEYFRAAFTDRGGEIAAEDTFSVGATDFSAQVAKIKQQSPAPDLIFTPAYVPDIGVFLKQLRASGIDIPVLGTDGADSTLLVEVGGNAAEGMIFTSHGIVEPGSTMEQFYADYEDIKGSPPESNFSALGGDAVAVIDAAVTAAGSTEPAAVRDALASLENVEGVTGLLTYKDQNGTPLKNVYIATVEGGAFVLIDKQVPTDVPAP